VRLFHYVSFPYSRAQRREQCAAYAHGDPEKYRAAPPGAFLYARNEAAAVQPQNPHGVRRLFLRRQHQSGDGASRCGNADFLDTDLSTSSYEYYSELDSLGRCGVAYACVGIDLMPSEERGEIGPVKPSGWHTVKYDVVDGKYLYNRCHLIAYQLSGENANVNNLITGTRYMNVEGMLPFENMVADYVKETGNHVMYRVSPIFAGDDLVASGVQMEAKSVG